MKKIYLLLGLFLLGVCSSLHAQSFNLQTGREPITSLDGLWRFHTGDNPAWASPHFDDSKWPLLRSDESWTKQGYPDYSGYAWYRFTVQVPDGSKPLGLLLPQILTGYQVYANGKLIGSAGSTAHTRDPGFVGYASFLLPACGAGPQTIHIALRVWNYKPIASWLGGGPLGPGNAVGDPVLLTQHLHWYRDASALALVNSYAYSLFAALVGLTILALFLFRPSDREYLWFSVLLLAAAVHVAMNVAWGFVPILYVIHIILLRDIAVGLSAIAALAFFSIVLDARRSFLWRTACIAAAASPLTMVLYYFQWTSIGSVFAIFLCCLLPAYIWVVAALAIGALRKNASARLLLVPALLYFGFWTVADVVQIGWIFGWQRKLRIFELALVHYPFPLYVANVINYIFVFALLIFLVHRFSLARQEETRLSTEMEAARGMQSLLVPATPPSTPGFTVESVYLPASEVGGDFFQVLPGKDGSLLVVVGDVSGKGLRAAMTVSTIVGALRGCTVRKPADVLAYLNRVLHGQVGGFVTCCAALIAPDGEMTLANAGNPAPYRNGREMAVEAGLPLGILAEDSYSETHYQLAGGDRLTFVSDGVVEATNEKRELFGFERTEQISSQAAAAIAEAARKFGQEDDITVLRVEFAGAGAIAMA